MIDTFQIDEIDTCGDATCAEPASPSSDEFGAVDALTWINNMLQRMGGGNWGCTYELRCFEVSQNPYELVDKLFGIIREKYEFVLTKIRVGSYELNTKLISISNDMDR